MTRVVDVPFISIVSKIGVAPLGSNSEEASHEDQKEEVGAGSLVLCVCWFGCPAANDSKTGV